MQASGSSTIAGPARSALKVIAAGLSGQRARPGSDSALDRLAGVHPDEFDELIHRGRAVLWPNKKPLSHGTLRNYRAVLSTLVTFSREQTGHDGIKPLNALREATRRGYVTRPRLDPSRLSEAAKADMERFAAFKMARVLPVHERAHRKATWRKVSADSVSQRLLAYWARLESYLGRESTRVERFSPMMYFPVITDYIEEGERLLREGVQSFPGYKWAELVAANLQIGCREYLAAHHPEDLEAIYQECGGDPYPIFRNYREDMHNMYVTTERGRHKVDTADIDIDIYDVREAGLKALEVADRIRAESGSSKSRLATELVYRRAGLLLVVLSAWPMRIRNISEMRWDHNLKQDEDGLWTFKFSGEELKVARRGKAINIHEGTFSLKVSALITQWRDHLETVYGAGITKAVPYVFLTNGDLRTGLAQLNKVLGQREPVDPIIAAAEQWLHKSSEARRAAAVEAAEREDFEALWDLTAAYAYFTDGRQPLSPSKIRNDHRAIRKGLDSKIFKPLLNPPPGAQDDFKAHLAAKGQALGTIKQAQAGMKKLFEALRWAGATDTDAYASAKAKSGALFAVRNNVSGILRRDFIATVYEFTGVRLTPHRVRNLMTDALKELAFRVGVDPWGLLSLRLNNHRLTAYKEYNQFDPSSSVKLDLELDTLGAGDDTNTGIDLAKVVASLTPQERRDLLSRLLSGMDGDLDGEE